VVSWALRKLETHLYLNSNTNIMRYRPRRNPPVETLSTAGNRKSGLEKDKAVCNSVDGAYERPRYSRRFFFFIETPSYLLLILLLFLAPRRWLRFPRQEFGSFGKHRHKKINGMYNGACLKVVDGLLFSLCLAGRWYAGLVGRPACYHGA